MCILHTNNYYYTRLEASFPGQPGRYQKGKASLDLNDAKDDEVFGMAVASAGTYENNLHLNPDR